MRWLCGLRVLRMERRAYAGGGGGTSGTWLRWGGCVEGGLVVRLGGKSAKSARAVGV